MKNDNEIRTLLTILKNYLENRDTRKNFRSKSPKIIHYYNEIIRFRSKLNFIMNKTLRSLRQKNQLPLTKKARYFYAMYRILWESASIDMVLTELEMHHDPIIIAFLQQLKSFSWEKALSGKTPMERLSIKEAIPTFFIEHLLPTMSLEQVTDIIIQMNSIHKNDQCTVRFNSLAKREQKKQFVDIEQELKINKIDYYVDEEIPELIHVPIQKKKSLIQNHLYKEGFLILQDKASATVAKILNPHPGENICDMCAAPGMKTSLIAQQTKDKARIIAGEFLLDRSLESRRFLDHLNVSSSNVINTDSILFPTRPDMKFDKVLLDAPCTGSGTFLVNPELKWRQNEKFLHQNTILQEKLLNNAIKLLKLDGILVYSTCSLYPEEGEMQVQKVIDQLEPQQLPGWLSPSYSHEGAILPGTGRLFPSIHGTQGFFIGKFKKL